MSTLAMDAARMIDMLPADDQRFAYEFVKKLVLAWDPDFTKITPNERKRLELAEIEIEKGETVSHEDIDWS